MRDLRAEAIAVVDHRHGHAITTCPNPFVHRMDYDDEHARLQGEVVCTVHGHDPEDAGDGLRLCTRCGTEIGDVGVQVDMEWGWHVPNADTVHDIFTPDAMLTVRR